MKAKSIEALANILKENMEKSRDYYKSMRKELEKNIIQNGWIVICPLRKRNC